jgi:hypothetical protein
MKDFSQLPGYELVEPGLRDLQNGIESVEALLVSIASRRLRRAGLPIPPAAQLPREPELELYRLLRQLRPTDAYSAYNALLRRITKFESALERATLRSSPSPRL